MSACTVVVQNWLVAVWTHFYKVCLALRTLTTSTTGKLAAWLAAASAAELGREVTVVRRASHTLNVWALTSFSQSACDSCGLLYSLRLPTYVPCCAALHVIQLAVWATSDVLLSYFVNTAALFGLQQDQITRVPSRFTVVYKRCATLHTYVGL